MNDSGETARLPDPPARTPPPPRPQEPGSVDNPTWLTESPYAHPLTDASGNVRKTGGAASRQWFKTLILLFALMVPLSIALVCFGVYWEARNARASEAGAIVVMGAAQYNGRPSNVFQARLDHALDLYEQGFAPLVVLTGGNMPGDAFTEAETGARYLRARGVPQSAIRWENEGRDSWQSMQGVAAMLEGTGVSSLLIVSDGFHLLRSELMARELGFTAFGSAAPDSPIRPWTANEFSYVIRETGGILALVPTLVGFN